ncbi:serine/threonine protein kinase [Dictyobacter formicarum]|uniref:Protein kinase domain-containing protein n=1 Tax=Dictyobacter formicarum TaxID=2778368 RepID=A0ABQ3VGP8_9CHLR|nr:serine/threonine-protein kinase [Dictyobacter formicarum]GHO84879.1 hypothetical protein KSZ_28850 [Dictyobacter formicarum]
MQGAYTHLLVGNTVLDRYIIEEQLGQGGFGAVYKVRDQQEVDKVFALKEVAITNQAEHDLFTFESEVLKRLRHSALPRIYYSFENTSTSRAYMLMDYIEGPNLEQLRQQRTMKRFSAVEAITILTPIAQAIHYLHMQQPPIVHRDIKPANIIYPIAGSGAILVDFGIAKVYEQDATTSVMRMCSPGYGAPEQYVGGTNPHTDIYGLAATLYALISGEVPVEAISRLTQIGGKQRDPLKPLTELVPGVPAQVASAIQQAMALNSAERFDSIEQFWQALNAPATRYSSPALVLGAASAVGTGPLDKTTALVRPQAPAPDTMVQGATAPRKSSKRIPILAGLALLVVVIGVLIGSGLSLLSASKAHSHAASTPTALSTIPTTTNVYPHLHPYYIGKISSVSNDSTTSGLILSKIQQTGATIKGTINIRAIRKAGPFDGAVTTDNGIHFIVTGKEVLRFQGTIRASGALAGTYCHRVDATTCTFMGTWEAAPTKTELNQPGTDSQNANQSSDGNN